MQDSFCGFGRRRFNPWRFGGGQTQVVRRVIVSNDSPTQLSTLDPFLTSRFRGMLPTMELPMNRITHHRFFDDDDDDDDDFPAPFPSKVEPRKAPPRYDGYYNPPPKAPPPYGEYYKPPPRANPPMMYGGYYGDGFYPPGGNPVNVHLNLHMGPPGSQAPNQHANSNDNANSNQNANNNHNANSNDNDQAGLPAGWPPHLRNPQVQEVNYIPNGYYDSQTVWPPHTPQVQGGNYNPNGNYNSQTGGGQYNPQVQGGNKVDGDGKITMGSEIGNIKLGGGKAGGDQTGGGNYNANSNYNAK